MGSTPKRSCCSTAAPAAWTTPQQAWATFTQFSFVASLRLCSAKPNQPLWHSNQWLTSAKSCHNLSSSLSDSAVVAVSS